MRQDRFHASAGIAIGPILFVVALLAVLAAAVSSGGSGFQVATVADRVTADIVAQANLIRNTINQCNILYQTTVATNPAAVSTYSYPSSLASGTAVSALTCTPMGGTAMFGGALILLPQPTAGFNAWTYIDASGSGGGRCIWTTPTGSNPINNAGIVAGLTRAAAKFNTNTTSTYSSGYEAWYYPSSSSQKFIVWITMPTGTASSYCSP